MVIRFAEQWPRIDDKGLASFVTPDAGSGIRLGVDRKALESTTDGRRAIVAAIFEALKARGIRYAAEPYHPSDTVQRIRTPSEIFANGEGTCLDLALLFCGVCLHFDLLPYVIVFEDHAIAAVSATHLLADWNGIRPGFVDFASAPLTDALRLRELVRQGVLIPVECTGLATSEYLSRADLSAQRFPEAVGRVDGVMSYGRAVAAGVEQINGGRFLRFATDIAIAQYLWRMPLMRLVSHAPQETLGPSLQTQVENFIAYYLGSAERPAPFGGRSEALKRLNDWLAMDVPYGIVLAPAGKGKSALLVRWMTQQRSVQDGPHVAFFPISVRYETNQAVPALRTIAESLAACHGEPPPDSKEIAQLRASIKRSLQQAPRDGRPLALVIDGLDEAAHWKVDRNLFPFVLPGKVKILLATRPLAGDANHSVLLAQLGIPRKDATFFPLGALELQGIVEIVRGLGRHLQPGEQTLLATRLFDLSEGDPLLLRLYLDELDVARSSFEPMLERLGDLDVGIDGYMQLWCAEQKELRDVNPLEDSAARTLLEVCAHAFGPLGSLDITVLGGAVLSTSTAIQRTVPLVDRLLIGDGKTTGYVFSHPRLADYIRGLLTPQEQRSWERRFLDYGRSTLTGLRDCSLRAAEVSPYLLRYLSAHLQRSSPQELASLLSLEWMRAWEERSGAVSGFLDDLNLVWEEARAMGEAGLSMQIKAALYSSSLASTVRQIWGVTLQAALRNNLVSPIKALSLTRRHTSADVRSHCLGVTIPFIPDEEQRDELWEEWLDLVCKVPTLKGQRTGCLRHHVNQIPAKFTQPLLDLIRHTGDRASRIGMYCWMLGRLSGEELQQALETIVKEIESEPELQPMYLEALPLIPYEHRAPFLERALEFVLSYEGPPENRPEMMGPLVRCTQGAEREKFLQLALKMVLSSGLRARYKARALMHVLPLLTEPPSIDKQKGFLEWTTDLDSHEQNEYVRLLSDKITEPVMSEEWFYLHLVTDDIDQDAWAVLALRLIEPMRSEEFRKAWDKIRERLDSKGMEQLSFVFTRVPEEWKDKLRAEVMAYLRKNIASLSFDSMEDVLFDLYAHYPEEIYGLVMRHLGETFPSGWICRNSQRFRPEHERELVRMAWDQSRIATDGASLVKALAAIVLRLPEKERISSADFILGTPYAHQLEDDILPVLETMGTEAVRQWLLDEPAATRGDIAIKIARRRPQDIRERLEEACISRSPFGVGTRCELSGYGIDASVTVDAVALVTNVSVTALHGLVETLIAGDAELEGKQTLEVITAMARRLEPQDADRLADWIYPEWSAGAEEEKRYLHRCFCPLLASMSPRRRDELVIELLEFVRVAPRESKLSMLRALLPYLAEDQVPLALEMVDSYAISPVRLAAFLREVGQRLPATSAARFLERCDEFGLTYAFLVIETRSALAAHMSVAEKDAFVQQMRGPALRIDYVRDRVNAVRYLCQFCDADTQKDLWQEVVGTEGQEAEYLSSGDLGISVSPRLNLFDAIAEMGPPWLLLRCLEAAAGHESSHSNSVVEEVLNRWSEVCSIGRSEEIRGLTLLIRHGVPQGRTVLLENLTRASMSLTTVQCSGFATTLHDLLEIVE